MIWQYKDRDGCGKVEGGRIVEGPQLDCFLFNEVPKGQRHGDGTELAMYADTKHKRTVWGAPKTSCFIDASSSVK